MDAEESGGVVHAEIDLLRAQEQLRQERETFDQRKQHDGRWFQLKLVMGWTSVVLLPGIGFACGFIIFNYRDFSPATVTVSTTALLVDTLGLVMSVWRLVLGKSPDPLEPIGVVPSQPTAQERPVADKAMTRRRAGR